MRIVVDTNILFSFFWKDSFTRNILLNPNFEFISSVFAIAELKKYASLIMKKTGLTYTLVSLYKINMDSPYYTCEPGKTIDNSKQKCDKYLPFEYTPKENLDLGTYKITLSGKDKADIILTKQY